MHFDQSKVLTRYVSILGNNKMFDESLAEVEKWKAKGNKIGYVLMFTLYLFAFCCYD